MTNLKASIMKTVHKYFLLLALLILAVGCKNDRVWNLASGIYILDKDKPVKTYEDLAARLPRKAIYVDRWATWCEPCLEEFEHYDSLRTFLGEHDIAILYLNSDMNIEESRWFEFIKEHELYGYHVRLSQDLIKDLIANALFNPLIPQFMIIDSTGRVLNKNAERPSNGEALYNQLTETLGLQVNP